MTVFSITPNVDIWINSPLCVTQSPLVPWIVRQTPPCSEPYQVCTNLSPRPFCVNYSIKFKDWLLTKLPFLLRSPECLDQWNCALLYKPKSPPYPVSGKYFEALPCSTFCPFELQAEMLIAMGRKTSNLYVSFGRVDKVDLRKCRLKENLVSFGCIVLRVLALISTEIIKFYLD